MFYISLFSSIDALKDIDRKTSRERENKYFV